MAGDRASIEQLTKRINELELQVDELTTSGIEVTCDCDPVGVARIEAMLHHARLRTKDAAAGDLLTLLLDGLYAR